MKKKVGDPSKGGGMHTTSASALQKRGPDCPAKVQGKKKKRMQQKKGSKTALRGKVILGQEKTFGIQAKGRPVGRG